MFKSYEFKLDNPEREWNDYLWHFKDYHIFQSFPYGQYLQAQRPGVKIKHYLQWAGQKPAVMAQVIIKEFKPWPVAFIVIKGGPIYNASENHQTNLGQLKKFLKDFVDSLKKQYKLFYINIQINNPANVLDKLLLRELGWRKPPWERYSFLTFVVPIHKEIKENFDSFQKKWRNQLRQAERLNHIFNWGNDEQLIERYIAVHNKMCEAKKMGHLKLGIKDLLLAKKYLRDNLQILIGSLAEEDVCGTVILIFQQKAYYLYAASSQKGRSIYSANLLIWDLIKRLSLLGIKELDLLGVDPQRNWGSYHFKQGIGGAAVELLGEWEYFSRPLLRIPLALWLRLRRRF